MWPHRRQWQQCGHLGGSLQLARPAAQPIRAERSWRQAPHTEGLAEALETRSMPGLGSVQGEIADGNVHRGPEQNV